MTDILLLEGPDGNHYKATQFAKGDWLVIQFLNRTPSEWWRDLCGRQWILNTTISDRKLKETFSILAATETETPPADLIIHYD